MPRLVANAHATIASKRFDADLERLKESIRHHRDAIAAALEEFEWVCRQKEAYLAASVERV